MRFLINSFLLSLFVIISISGQVHLSKNATTSHGFILSLSFDKEPYFLEGEKGKIINYYNAVDESKSGMPLLPSKTVIIAIPPESKIKVSLSDEKYQIINNVIPKSNPTINPGGDTSLVYLDTNISPKYTTRETFPDKNYVIEGYTWIRDYYCAIIRINTHVYNWKLRQVNELLKVKVNINIYDNEPFSVNNSVTSKFDESLNKVILNLNEAKNFRSFQPNKTLNDSTGNWIDYSKEYVKLQIPANAVYKIDYNELLSYGIDPASFNPHTLKIYSKGNEIPLYVSGESDNSFDPGDYIEFWAEKNYGYPNYKNLVNQGEDYLPYLDIYSDTSIVWLSWNGNNGKRSKIIQNYISGLTDSITSHLVKIHLEKDNLFWYYGFYLARIQLPFWHECKTWIWQQIASSSSGSFAFSANSIVPNTSIYTLSRLNSWSTDDIIPQIHKYGAKLNSGNIQDSVIFNFETIANLEAIFNSNSLVQGTNNYRVVGMPNDQGILNRVVLDWIDIDYFQYTNAINDSLLIRIPDSVSYGQRILKVSNYSADSLSTLIYKIGEPREKITSFVINGNVLSFSDSVRGGDKYIIINNSYIKKPIFVEKKQFINLRNPGKQADYILISNKLLQQSAVDYANFIEINYPALNIETVYVNDIYDEFGYGYLRPEAIKGFLEYAYFNWQSPKPTYLVLLGDCTYDYKNHFNISASQLKKILVPSFGQPVSDSWFTMWDTTNINIQQMFVGRIPANNNEEVYRYLQKHQTYIQRNFDDWNKKFLLFSGGFPDDPDELQQIKAANDDVFNNIIHPAPVGGEAVHFYKTISPLTNLGPYTVEEIQQAFDQGGLFISYVGHSGTRVWDNGISEPSDIKNAYNDRLPLITDNGCSTGKFAEPDIDAFGELFINQDENGQAIEYLGNSSLGYTSTAFRMPEIFYNRLIVDTTFSIGEAHFLSKIDNFNQSGFTDVNRVYNYCNILIGDPVIKFAFPDKPNFVANQNSVIFNEKYLTDQSDSTDVRLIIANWGKVTNDSLQINIESTFSDTLIYSYNKTYPTPLFSDTLNFRIPLLGLAGEHKLNVVLDKNNLVDEVNENDNSVEISFIVYSTKLRIIEPEFYYNSSRSVAKILNPVISPFNQLSEIEIAFSLDADFTNQVVTPISFDSVATYFPLNNLQQNTRYYWRARLNGTNQEWTRTFSFFNNYNYSWFLNHSFNPDDISTNQVEYDSLSQVWKIREGTNYLTISSAGFVDGKYASIKYNYLEYVPNVFFRGFATALIDTFDLHPENVQSFKPDIDSLINYLNSLGQGTVLAIAATDEVSAFLTGTVGDSLKQILRGFGSVYVDSIGWRDSWAMIGIKGAPQGSVPEAFSRSSQGPAIIDTSKYLKYSEGTVQFPIVEIAVKWINVIKNDSLPSGSIINYLVVGYKDDNSIDTIGILQFDSNISVIDTINSNVYKKLSIYAELNANSNLESPEIKELAVNFIPPPELATNYQVVSASADTVTVGENVDLNFSVYNVGESTADSFTVNVDIINDDNSRENIFSQMLDSLSANGKSYFNLSYNTSTAIGSKSFLITIDPYNSISEMFEDNNFFSVPFFIKADTTTPTLKLTIDGNDILDGEYISAKPDIRMEMSDFSLLPVTDPNSVLVFLNDEEIPNDTSIISYEFSTTNPKVIVDYTPELEDGEYILKVLWRNTNGQIVDSSGVQKAFLVSSEAKIMDVYNYPNPTKGETHFTFRLTQIPEEIKIKIYTIAGRLIREMQLTSSELRYDFNKIYWDGKDQDGDQIANGVYLYKVIMKAGDKTEDVTQKLAIVR